MTHLANFIRNSYPNRLRRSALEAVLLILLVGSASAQTVTKNSADGPTPSSLAPGAAAGSYALNGFDSVNFATGSLSFSLPLLTVGGRGAAQYTMMLPIERHWSVKAQGHYESCAGSQTCFHWDYYWPDSTLGETPVPGYGAGVVQGRQTGVASTPCPNTSQGYSTTLTVLTFTMPDRSQVELRDAAHNGQPLAATPCNNTPDQQSRGRVFNSADGSAMTFISDTEIKDYWQGRTIYPTGYLLTREGTRYRIINGLVRWIRDRNGNQLQFVYETENQFGPSGGVTKITDSIGRQVNISYASSGQPYDDIAFSGYTGTIRHIHVVRDGTSGLRSDYQPMSWAAAFPELNGASQWTGVPPPSGPSYVQLPNDQRYRFFYNPYGELARVELPTGGAYEYDWASGRGVTGSGAVTDGSGNGNVYRRVMARRVYPNGGTGSQYAAKMTVSRSGEIATVKEYIKDEQQTEQQAALVSSTEHHYHGDPSYITSSPINYPAWNDNREFETDIFAENGITLLRKVSYNWQPRVTYSWASADPRLVETVTTLADVTPNLVTKQSSLDPSSQVPGFDQYNNQTNSWEYDYGSSTPTRHTRTKYLTTNIVNGITYYYDTVNSNTTNPDINATFHLRNLPEEQFIYSIDPATQAETLVAHTLFSYDQTTLTPRPNISGLCTTIVPNTSPVQCDNSSPTTYLQRGNVTRTSRWRNTDGAWLNTDMQYDVAGNVTVNTDPLAHSITFDYADKFGFADNEARSNSVPTELNSTTPASASYAFPTQVTNALGQVAYTQYDYYLGKPVNTEDANGVVSSLAYDDLLDRQQALIRDVNNLAAKSRTIIDYDDTNRVITTFNDQTSFSDGLFKTESLYDGLGRSVETHVYETSTTYITTRQEYDGLGRVKRSYNPYRTTADATYGGAVTTYDALSRVSKVETFDASGITGTVQTDYYGTQTLVTDQSGKQRMSQTSALGRLTDVWEITPNNQTIYPGIAGVSFGTQNLHGYLTHYDYDALDNMTTVTQGSQTPRTFIYNSLKQLTDATNPESGHIHYDYDNNGNQWHRTDGRSITTTFGYDALNRVISKTYSDATPAVAYIYDNQPLPAGAPSYTRGASTGKLVAVTYGGGSTGSYLGYDPIGRTSRSLQVTNNGQANQTYQMLYILNIAGEITSQSYPSGRVVYTEYDRAGRVTGIKKESGGYYAGGVPSANPTDPNNPLQYTAHGAVAAMQLGNGLWEHTSFNSRLQITQIGLGSTSTSSGVLQLGYGYGTTDNNGNLKSQTITVPTTGNSPGFTDTQTYDYDALNRIMTALENNGTSWKQAFIYDRYGNRSVDVANTSSDLVGLNPSISTSNNQITPRQDEHYHYDAAGNLDTDAVNTPYLYDAENRLVTFNNGPNPLTNGATYIYDGTGQRIKKVTGSETTIFVYDVTSRLVAEYSTSAQQNPGVTSYLTADGLSSPRAVTNQSGAVIARHDYLPFGEEIGAKGGRGAHSTYGVESLRQQFTQKERDAESGLDYFGARYYASTQGRFISVDPMMASSRANKPQSWNRYTYVLNNPLRFIDPEGLMDDGPDGKKKTAVIIFYGGAVSTDTSTPTQVQPGPPAPGLGETTMDTEGPNIAQQIANDFPDAAVTVSGPNGVNQISSDLIRSKPDNILIYGFSAGGNSAIGLTNILTNNGVKVDQLTTVDPAGFSMKGATSAALSATISVMTDPSALYPSNIRNAAKENAGLVVMSGNQLSHPNMVGDAVNYSGTLQTQVSGANNQTITPSMRERSSTPFVHTSMDDIMAPRVVQRIEGRLSQIYNRPQK